MRCWQIGVRTRSRVSNARTSRDLGVNAGLARFFLAAVALFAGGGLTARADAGGASMARADKSGDLIASADAGGAQTLAALFSQGNEAFFRSDYETAIARYDALLEVGVRDPDVYYNLATTHGRRGQLGYAVLYLERAKRLAPGDDAIAEQLRKVRDQVGIAAAERAGEVTLQTRPPLREAIFSGLSENTLALLLLLLETLCGAAILSLPRAPREQRVALRAAAYVCGLLALVALLGLLVKAEVGRPGDAAVILEQVQLLEGPDPKAQSRAVVEAGTLARVLGQEGGFSRVSVGDGPEGWLSTKDVGLIDPD